MLLLQPAYQDYLWGGRTLKAEYGKADAPIPAAESWELSTHPDGLTRILGGPFDGQTFAAWRAEHPAADGLNGAAFPILVKLIDAQKSLSVQVHPDDAYALERENSRGKTELWYILEAKPGATMYLGLNRSVTKEELRTRIADGTVEQVLRKVPVRPGEAYYIPAGMLHAIGAGIVLAEVQETSNLTYRVYDYRRRDAAGDLRPLHVKKALEVATLTPTDCTPPGAEPARTVTDGATAETIVRCPYFSMQRMTLYGAAGVQTPQDGFCHVLCVNGAAEAKAGGQRAPLAKGAGLFLSAGETAEFAGNAELLLISRGNAALPDVRPVN